MPQNPATRLDFLSIEVANLLADAIRTAPKIIDSSDDEAQSWNCTSELLKRAQIADAGLAVWPESLPLNWLPIQVCRDSIPQEVIEAGMYGDNCEIYPDIMICSTWNDWRVARLKVLRLIAELRRTSIFDNSESAEQVIDQMQQLVDGICASVPYCLGNRTVPAPLYDAEIVYPGLKGRLNSKEHQKTAVSFLF